MKIVNTHISTLDRLAPLMRPEHYVGFLHGCAIISVLDIDGFGCTGDAQTFLTLRDDFVTEQRDNDEPTGLPVAPLYWTDLHPEPMDSLRDVMGQCEHGCVHMLNSTIEPHARWFVILGGGDDDDVTEFFDSLGRAEKYLENMLEDQRVRHDEAVADVKRLYRSGTPTDVDEAERIMEDYSLAYSTHRDDPGHVTIEGERIKIGGGDEPAEDPAPEAKADCIADVKKALGNGNPLQAAGLAKLYGIAFSWAPEDAFTAIIGGERFNCFPLNVCDPARAPKPGVRVEMVGDFQSGIEKARDDMAGLAKNEVPPGLAIETVEPIDAPTAEADVIPAGSILSRGAAIESVKAHLLAGDRQGAAKIAVVNSIPLSVRSDGSYAHVDHVRLDIPRIVPRPSPETAVIMAVDIKPDGMTVEEGFQHYVQRS